VHLVLAILLVLTVTSANDAIDRDTGNDGVAYDDKVIEYLYKGA